MRNYFFNEYTNIVFITELITNFWRKKKKKKKNGKDVYSNDD